jgi:hypothetical protein
MTPRKQDLKSLRNLISEAHNILATTTLPEGRSERACELLSAAVRLADDLLSVSPAAALGKKGGKKTAQRGPEYYARIAGMRKTHAGGRPPKETA